MIELLDTDLLIPSALGVLPIGLVLLESVLRCFVTDVMKRRRFVVLMIRDAGGDAANAQTFGTVCAFPVLRIIRLHP